MSGVTLLMLHLGDGSFLLWRRGPNLRRLSKAKAIFCVIASFSKDHTSKNCEHCSSGQKQCSCSSSPRNSTLPDELWWHSDVLHAGSSFRLVTEQTPLLGFPEVPAHSHG